MNFIRKERGNKVSKQTTDTIKVIYDEMKRTKSDSIHFTANQIYKDEKACAVISVLDGKKPPHMILDELIQWAEENNHQELLDRINSLEDDLSFLNEGNIKTF